MTDQTPEPEILTMGEPPSDPVGPASDEPGSTSTTLLVVLWLATAAALALAPFWSFTKYEITQDGEVVSGYDANGWGVVSGLEDNSLTDSHAPRWGIVLALLAAALLLAAVVALLRRAATWPARLGAFASAMTFAVAAVVLLDQEAWLSNETSEGGITYDVTTGLGIGLVLVAAIAAAAALAVGLTSERRR